MARRAGIAACGLSLLKVNPLMSLLGLVLALAAMPVDAAPVQVMAPIKVMALGDSLTAGYGLPADDAFPVQLQKALAKAGIQADIVNAGVSGDTAAGGLARLDWSMADHPAYALVEFGGNDALRGVDPDVTYDNLDRILTRLQAAGIKPMLLGIKSPNNWGPDYAKRFDAIYPRLAAKHKVPLYPFFLDGAIQHPAEDIQADGLHPTAHGVDVIVQRMLPQVEAFLGSSRS